LLIPFWKKRAAYQDNVEMRPLLKKARFARLAKALG